jgi:hypothetical protein
MIFTEDNNGYFYEYRRGNFCNRRESHQSVTRAENESNIIIFQTMQHFIDNYVTTSCDL